MEISKKCTSFELSFITSTIWKTFLLRKSLHFSHGNDFKWWLIEVCHFFHKYVYTLLNLGWHGKKTSTWWWNWFERVGVKSRQILDTEGMINFISVLGFDSIFLFHVKWFVIHASPHVRIRNKEANVSFFWLAKFVAALQDILFGTRDL